jgi:hypothetical protein
MTGIPQELSNCRNKPVLSGIDDDRIEPSHQPLKPGLVPLFNDNRCLRKKFPLLPGKVSLIIQCHQVSSLTYSIGLHHCNNNTDPGTIREKPYL